MNELIGNKFNAEFNAEKESKDIQKKRAIAADGKLINHNVATRTSHLKSVKMNAMARKMKGLPPINPQAEY